MKIAVSAGKSLKFVANFIQLNLNFRLVPFLFFLVYVLVPLVINFYQ